MDGRYKACLVAKGFSQIYGEDYDKTFSPVTCFETVQLLLAYACRNDWDIEGLDVKTAFLYGQLDEEIYMEQPEGFKISSSNQVYCLLHSLWPEASHTSMEQRATQVITQAQFQMLQIRSWSILLSR